uniref:Uncharacterized protein n=2 Tax=Triticinae TaxID=1648030 RepID=A0A453PL26_AEGTS
GRCYYCEKEGAKIVHPDLEKYIGRDPTLSAWLAVTAVARRLKILSVMASL